QISPRTEQVALTLGCSRSQAFWLVVLPQASRGLLTAGTLAWARSLGEFGPILVFSGATRMRTEVLSTTVFLELSIGNLEAVVTAAAYQQFLDCIDGLDADLSVFDYAHPEKLQQQCARLRHRLLKVALPSPVQEAVRDALARLGAAEGDAFAVRSSSTFEDLA